MDYSNCSCCGMLVDQQDLVVTACSRTLYHAACLDTQDSVYGIKTCPSCRNRFTTTKLDEIYRLSKRTMVCGICFQPTPFVKRVLECNHWCHMICLAEWVVKTTRTPSCPTCRGEISEDSVNYLKKVHYMQTNHLLKIQDHLNWHAARNGVLDLIKHPELFSKKIAEDLLEACKTHLTGADELGGWYDDRCGSSEHCSWFWIEKWPHDKLAHFLHRKVYHGRFQWDVDMALKDLYRETHIHNLECGRDSQVCWLPQLRNE